MKKAEQLEVELDKTKEELVIIILMWMVMIMITWLVMLVIISY